jgi:hypothetical protein
MKKNGEVTILALFILLMMTGCRNSYENHAIGHNISYTHLLVNREGPFPDNSKAEIDLNPDMTFSFKKEKVTIIGIWSAYDDGDHTWLA